MSRGCVCARQGDTRGLTHEQVRAMFKSTLSGLFRHLSGAFRGQEQYTRPQVLNTLRGGLEVRRGFFHSYGEPGGNDRGGGNSNSRKRRRESQQEEDEDEENKIAAEVEVSSEKNSPGEKSDEDITTEERWKEEEVEVHNNIIDINSIHLKEKVSSENDKKENWKEPVSLCLEAAEEKPEEDG
ncbi:hypothetical protein GWK47_039089 [Chionoecetes opilio]|uniref:Uncharacterized protein n=1 Tax=Chionoecetes opilio TaxID=41210 RepID=A0A8J4YKF1_CHIOP|nr:hypothetical protein GWK47_039089 [Chionoecetes opilio]